MERDQKELQARVQLEREWEELLRREWELEEAEAARLQLQLELEEVRGRAQEELAQLQAQRDKNEALKKKLLEKRQQATNTQQVYPQTTETVEREKE